MDETRQANALVSFVERQWTAGRHTRDGFGVSRLSSSDVVLVRLVVTSSI